MSNGGAPQGGMGGSQGQYMQLMQALMSNPQAFTGGAMGQSPFAQTLANNPGGMGSAFVGAMNGSPQSMAYWQPAMPAMQQAPNPIAALAAQSQQPAAAPAGPTPDQYRQAAQQALLDPNTQQQSIGSGS